YVHGDRNWYINVDCKRYEHKVGIDIDLEVHLRLDLEVHLRLDIEVHVPIRHIDNYDERFRVADWFGYCHNDKNGDGYGNADLDRYEDRHDNPDADPDGFGYSHVYVHGNSN
ncbi:MAG TPA: hypothetical protein VMX74_01335, partial [Pirellulales bacterium]|nr:hypothetical protein [Pirellulales bacterium]